MSVAWLHSGVTVPASSNFDMVWKSFRIWNILSIYFYNIFKVFILERETAENHEWFIFLWFLWLRLWSIWNGVCASSKVRYLRQSKLNYIFALLLTALSGIAELLNWLVQLTSSHCIFIAHWAIAGFGRSCLIISSLFHYRRFWVECIICILFNQIQFSLISLETNKQIIKKSQQLLSNKSNRVPANRQLHKGKLYVNITQSEHLKYRKQSVQLLEH